MTSVYIHIPFCKSFCYYCDFVKKPYNKEVVVEYLKALKNEVLLKYNGEKLKTIYIGGGTPSVLDLEELKELFLIIDLLEKEKDCEITFEINCESITADKLLFLQNKVNRLSFGVQTFNDELLKYLGRNHSKKEAISKIKLAQKYFFKNINVDLIYGINKQTLTNLKDDIEIIKRLNIPHISVYSLMLKENTKLATLANYIDEEQEILMYEYVQKLLKDYQHYEISNYAKENYWSKHNMVYWNNEKYYGFGLGACGYDGKYYYQNAVTIDDYVKGIVKKEEFSANQIIQNEFILGLRKLKGINEKEFINKYGKSFLDFPVVKELISAGYLKYEKNYLFIDEKYLYVSNEILVKLLENYE